MSTKARTHLALILADNIRAMRASAQSPEIVRLAGKPNAVFGGPAGGAWLLLPGLPNAPVAWTALVNGTATVSAGLDAGAAATSAKPTATSAKLRRGFYDHHSQMESM